MSSKSELTRAQLLRIQELEKKTCEGVCDMVEEIERAAQKNREADEELRQLKEKKQAVRNKIVFLGDLESKLGILKMAQTFLRFYKITVNNIPFLDLYYTLDRYYRL